MIWQGSIKYFQAQLKISSQHDSQHLTLSSRHSATKAQLMMLSSHRFMYDCHPQPLHQLPFDQRVQISLVVYVPESIGAI